jgi:L-fuconate dehydratase
MNPDPDYSAAVAILETDDPVLSGHGLTFTIGRGNEICVAAIRAFEVHVVGLDLDEIEADPGAFWRALAGDSQLRWLGPEKGVVHLALAAVVNAAWDLLARRAGKPLWEYLADLAPKAIVRAVDFRHISDVLSPAAALDLLEAKRAGRAARVKELLRDGYPAYVTSAGWLGYDEETVRTRCRAAVAEGWTHFKIKVGADLEDDIRRCRTVREEIGPDRRLMVDANQVWNVDDAIRHIEAFADFDLWWVEEPTSPDDILGHARIARAVHPIRIATGRQRGDRLDPAGRPLRRARLPSCGRCGTLRARAALLELRLHLRERNAREPHHRVRRPSPRALRSPGRDAQRALPAAVCSGARGRVQAGEPDRVRVPRRPRLEGTSLAPKVLPC